MQLNTHILQSTERKLELGEDAVADDRDVWMHQCSEQFTKLNADV